MRYLFSRDTYTGTDLQQIVWDGPVLWVMFMPEPEEDITGTDSNWCPLYYKLWHSDQFSQRIPSHLQLHLGFKANPFQYSAAQEN